MASVRYDGESNGAHGQGRNDCIRIVSLGGKLQYMFCSVAAVAAR